MGAGRRDTTPSDITIEEAVGTGQHFADTRILTD